MDAFTLILTVSAVGAMTTMAAARSFKKQLYAALLFGALMGIFII